MILDLDQRYATALKQIQTETSRTNSASLTAICEKHGVQKVLIQVLQNMGVIVKNDPGSSKKWIWQKDNCWTAEGDTKLLAIRVQEEIREYQRNIEAARRKKLREKENDKNTDFITNPTGGKSFASICKTPVDESVKKVKTIEAVATGIKQPNLQLPVKTPASFKGTIFSLQQIETIKVLSTSPDEIIFIKDVEITGINTIKFDVSEHGDKLTILFYGLEPRIVAQPTQVLIDVCLLELTNQHIIIDRTECSTIKFSFN